MNLHPMNRVTIVTEALAREPILALLREVGAHGWTLFTVEGSGHQGERRGDIPEFANIQIEVIVQPVTAETLLHRLHTEFFPRFAMVAYDTQVRVLRPAKF